MSICEDEDNVAVFEDTPKYSILWDSPRNHMEYEVWATILETGVGIDELALRYNNDDKLQEELQASSYGRYLVNNPDVQDESIHGLALQKVYKEKQVITDARNVQKDLRADAKREAYTATLVEGGMDSKQAHIMSMKAAKYGTIPKAVCKAKAKRNKGRDSVIHLSPSGYLQSTDYRHLYFNKEFCVWSSKTGRNLKPSGTGKGSVVIVIDGKRKKVSVNAQTSILFPT